MADNKQKILDIKVNYQKAVKSIAEYQTKIDEAKEAEKELKKQLENGEITRKQYNKEMAASKAQVASYNDSIRLLNKAVKDQLTTEREYGSYIEMGNAMMEERADSVAKAIELNKALREAVRNITDEEDKDRSIRQKLNAAINDNTNYIKRNSDSYIQQKMTIGDYREQVKLAMIEFKNGGATMQSCGIVAKQFADVLKMQMVSGWAAATTGGLSFVKALNLVKIAFAATGIGTVILLLSSLAAMLSKTQAGVEMFSKITASAGAVVSVFVDRLSVLGDALVKLFRGDFSGAAESAKSAISGIGKEIIEETKQTWKLKDALNKLEKQEVMLNMKRAAGRAVIEEQKRIADDVTLSMDERLKASKKAFDMEMQLGKESIEIGKKKLANMLGQVELTEEAKETIDAMAAGAMTADEAIGKLGLSNSTLADLQEFQQLFSEVAQTGADMQSRSKESQNKANEIRKAVADKAREARSKELDEVRAAEDALLALVTDKREKQRIEIGRSYDRQIEDLRAKLQTEKDLTAKAREAINTQIVALQQQKVDAMKKLSDEELQTELANKQKLIELQLAAVKEGTDAEYQLKMQQLQAQQEAELANTELTEEMKLAIKAKYNAQMDELSAAREQEIYNRQQEAMKTRFETEIAEAYGNEEEILRIKMEQKKAELDALQQFEGESQEEFNLRRLEAQNAFVESQEALSQKEIQIEEAKYDAMAQVTGGLIALTQQIGESDRGFALASKVLALAEIAINSGKAISKMVAAESGKGILGLGTMAAGIATILSNIANAIKIVKGAKFAQGGYVSGPGTGTSDSIPAHLSNGESVMTAQATSMFAPILSSFNQMGGGIPINVTATSNQQIGEDMLARAVAKGVQMAPAPVVSVEEINTVQKRLQVLERLSTL